MSASIFMNGIPECTHRHIYMSESSLFPFLYRHLVWLYQLESSSEDKDYCTSHSTSHRGKLT